MQSALCIVMLNQCEILNFCFIPPPPQTFRTILEKSGFRIHVFLLCKVCENELRIFRYSPSAEWISRIYRFFSSWTNTFRINCINTKVFELCVAFWIAFSRRSTSRILFSVAVPVSIGAFVCLTKSMPHWIAAVCKTHSGFLLSFIT